jgi:hypothetical protein
MQAALSLDSRALHGVVFDRYERPGNRRESSNRRDPDVNLTPILREGV